MACVDVIDLGERVEDFPGRPAKIARKGALVFASGERKEDGTLHTVSAEFTLSSHEKASLRLALESWRGRKYSDDELDAGLPLHKLTGQLALVLVEHATSKGGRTFAKPRAITPVPKAMRQFAPDVSDYTRAPYWEDRKAEYAAGVRKFRTDHGGATADHDSTFADLPTTGDTGDDLPF